MASDGDGSGRLLYVYIGYAWPPGSTLSQGGVQPCSQHLFYIRRWRRLPSARIPCAIGYPKTSTRKDNEVRKTLRQFLFWAGRVRSFTINLPRLGSARANQSR